MTVANLLEFKAGRMIMKGKLVEPDRRRGLIYLFRDEDTFVHFCWKDRSTAVTELDIIAFKDSLEYKRVEQCIEARVYVLKFKRSPRRSFFWMQGSHRETDALYCKRVNELIDANGVYHLPAGSEQPVELIDVRSYDENEPSSLTVALLKQARLSSIKEIVSNVAVTEAPAAFVPEVSISSSAASSVALLLTDLAPMAFEESSDSFPDDYTDYQLSMVKPIEFTILDAVQSICSDPTGVKALIKHLPPKESMSDAATLVQQHMDSPHFLLALAQFSYGFPSGKFGPRLEQFKLSPFAIAAAYDGDFEGFLYILSKTECGNF